MSAVQLSSAAATTRTRRDQSHGGSARLAALALEPQDARIVRMRALGGRWKAICWKVGLQRSTANERWLYALCVIAWWLSNGTERPVMSKRRLIDRVRRGASPVP